MVHLPPLPGYSGFPGMKALLKHVEDEVHLLESLGYDGVLLENENDQPHKVMSAPETTAAMAVLTKHAMACATKITVGAEILLNDPKASLASAFVGGASFIRTDYFVDRMERPEYGGEMAIDPEGLLAYRAMLGAQRVAILADIQVKYARMLEPRPIEESAILARQKGADAVIISGNFTGYAPSTADIERSASALEGFPVIIGSGLNVENGAAILSMASGAIVGTGIMTSGRVSPEKAAALVEIRNRLCG